MVAFHDGYWWSNDNLRLHYRDYPGDENRPPILCIPGLTRNARDFEGIAERLAGRHRVICVDLRGRGESAYSKDALSYAPLFYVQDIERLFDELGLQRVIAFGTSLGGIVTMLLAAADRPRFAGVLLNDVGPEIDPRGLHRIRGYVGKGGSWPTWIHAARALAELHGEAHPTYTIEDWLRMAKRVHKLTAQGRIVPDYDGKIAEAFRLPGGEAGIDLWPAFGALSNVPTLIVRGASSDILSEETARSMVARAGRARLVAVADTGHAPTLEEPECVAAIDAFLDEIGE